jgi:hypothetical protein
MWTSFQEGCAGLGMAGTLLVGSRESLCASRKSVKKERRERQADGIGSPAIDVSRG